MTDTPTDVCFPVRDCANFLRNSIRNLTPLTAANALSIIDGASNISVQQLENGEDCVDLQTVLDAGLVTVLFHQPQSPVRQAAFDVVLFGLQHIAERLCCKTDVGDSRRESSGIDGRDAQTCRTCVSHDELA